MIEVTYTREKGVLKTMPQEVQEAIARILEILDSEYGAYRNKYEDDGNVGDGAEEDIAVNIDKLLSQLIDIKEDIIKELNIRTTKFQSLIEMLS